MPSSGGLTAAVCGGRGRRDVMWNGRAAVDAGGVMVSPSNFLISSLPPPVRR